jgi:putative transposase
MKYQPQTIYHIYNQGNNHQPIFFNDDNYIFFLQKMRKHLLPHVEFLSYCLMPNHFHWLVYTKNSACEPSNAVKPRQKFNGGVSILSEKDSSQLGGNAKSKLGGSERSGYQQIYSSQSGGDSKSPPDYLTQNSKDYQQNLSHAIGTLLSSYTRAINKQQNRSGSLFRKETKSKSGIIDGFITINGQHKNLFFKPDNNYAATCFHYIHQNPVKANLSRTPEDWQYSSARDFAGLRNGTLCNQELAKGLLFGDL